MAKPEMTQHVNTSEIEAVFDEMLSYDMAAKTAEIELNKLKLSNAQKLKDVLISNLDVYSKKRAADEQRNFELSKKLIEQGFSTKAVLDSQAAINRKQERNKELVEALKRHKDELKGKSKAEQKELKQKQSQEIKEIKEKQKQQIKADKELLKSMDKETKKAFNTRLKEENKARLDSVKAEAEAAKKEYGKAGALVGTVKGLKNLKDSGASKSEVAGAAIGAGMDALQSYAQNIESTMKEVALTKTQIDTRLQGSKNSKTALGSYWDELSRTITQNVGVSPFVKQENVVNSLKTLVGQGISFNVEQRAFLDTISEKIATTFEATDASLLKLVRIQQADSTAARLGMESALTSFLNNMYETTEYMSQIASDIRAQIYEASALMEAEEAAEFEYQVQKWMGSLYSVGFNNASGLSGALGKLAAGDISGITDGGYGNLLVMAANKANLSIAEILADGLDDSSTNALMQAMVEYLGGIYDETKDNKVVAQQFANVYGLTASDLKAAANLAESTTNIYKQSLNYGGMLYQLNTMADSMWQRTSIGEMSTNLFENLNYTMAASMGNNPVLYATYTLGRMLEDTTGGIDIPFINAMGFGVDLNTSVAQLMQVGAMSGGILSGIGQLIAGIAKGSGGGFSGSGMLKAFGVNTSGTTTVSRGTGDGLVSTTQSGATTSFSGMIGNEDGSAVYDKTMTDATDEQDKLLAEAVEDLNETTMTTVDEHIVQIYNLLQDVVTGANKLHITFNGDSSWSSSGSTPSGVPIL